MKPYKTIRFTEGPDIADIHSEGRASHVGNLRRGETSTRYKDNIVQHHDGTPGRVIEKIVHSEHGVIRNPKAKASTRRYLKRVDKSRQLRDIAKDC